MADEIIKVGVNVDDGGTTRKTVKNVDDLRGSIDGVITTARTAKAVLAAMEPKSASRAKKDSQSSMENVEYGQARATVGTGAAGRDFAKQAQGLGGLVHVYATFAANLFAVSAAFTALSNAADTTNMVEGLKQLGAASGTNLALVSKHLVEATDGAISLKAAMTATAQASAAGMSGENLRRLGVAAKNTSLALGIDATDAISRLSRGITKLEPELLDELGIFTKLEKATADYARQIGKPVSALTDFEKRQAFANAVLTEAEQKFGNIKIDANPFSKLLASLKDVTQGMLEFINAGIGPVIKALAQSPTTLMVGIAALTALLLQKSIPAFTQWGAQLRATAEQAKETAANTKELFDAYAQSNKDQAVKRLSDTQKSFGDAAQAGMESARKAIKDGARLYNKEFNSLMKLDSEQLTADHAKVIEDTRKKLTTAATKAAASGDVKKAEAAQARLSTFETAAKDLVPAINNQLKFNEAVGSGIPKLGMMGFYHEEIAKKAELASKKYNILANAIDNTSFVGPILAFKSMILSIQGLGDKATFAGKAWLGLKGTIAIAATSLGMITSVVSGVLSAIGLITAALSALTVAFGKNGDEAERSTSSLADIKSNGESLIKTFELLEKSNPLEKLAPKNVAAVTNTMSELSNSILKGIKDTEKTIAARGGSDIITNWFAGLVGRSDEKLLAKRIDSELTKALDLATKTPESAKVRMDLTKMLGLDEGASTKTIVEAFKSTGITGAEMLNKLTAEANKGAQASKGFADSLKETTKQMQDLENELKFTDKLSTFANKGMKDFSELSKILKTDVVSGFSALLEIIKTPEGLVLLPEEIRSQIIPLIPELEALGTSFSNNQASINEATVGLSEYKTKLEEANKAIADNSDWTKRNWETRNKALTAQEQLPGLKLGISLFESQLKEANTRAISDTNTINKYTDLFQKATSEGFKRSSDIIANTLSTSMQKAALATQAAALSALPQTESIINKQNAVANKQIDLDISLINSQTSLVLETRLLRLEIENTRIEASKKDAADRAELKGTARDIALKATPRQIEIEAEQKASRLKAGSVKSPQALREMGVAPDAATELFNLFGKTASEIAKLKGQQVINSLNAAIKVVDKTFADKEQDITKRAEDSAAKLDILNKTMGISPELRQSSEYQSEALKITKEIQKTEAERAALAVERYQAVEKIVNAQAKLSANEKADLLSEYKRLTDISNQKLEQSKTNTEIARQQQDINDSYDLTAKRAEKALVISQQKLQVDQDAIESDKQKLDVQIMLGKMSNDEITYALRALAIRQAEKDATEALLTVTSALQTKLDAINKEREESMKNGAMLSGAQEAEYQRRKDDELKTAQSQGEAIKRTKDLKIDSANATTLLLDRDKAYGESFKQAFKGMEDAMVEFTKTGKLNFKSMIDSFIEGLLRYEIQQQQIMLFKGLGGATGLGKMGASFFNSLFSPTPTSNNFTAGIDASGMYAQGGAWDSGVQKFAMGGAFTNSVVTSPTLFKFAKGTGMMGEAGPEAIMPLKRDSNGNLGVRSGGGGQTSVVVNNYSNTQATTKETVDSRGNRKIDIVIGDIVAGEIGRPGSAVQQSFSNNFNARPAIARR